ncbi:maleylpyruvate isomerase N-terminal domain-containing protein [Nocardioides sp. LHG3406-4]|uniref:maleylpyruvate isomerase N-terminal domain-containing protein n=1 Tax=Nocardioides sp. LHG3406-4 TaxID=2804575 RepID=UPI003CF17942
MALTFTGTLDRAAVVPAVDQLTDLVASPEVAAAWRQESTLPGMTVGGLARHLVSQPECAVEFLRAEGPPGAETVSLADYFDRVDWLTAPVDSIENTSIRDDFNQMSAGGPAESVAILQRSRDGLGAAIEAAGPTTFVPWQGCSLRLDDFLVCRLMEVVVHADDLAVSIGHPTPTFAPEVLDPVLSLVAALSVRRHGQDAVLRALARSERSSGSVSAF